MKDWYLFFDVFKMVEIEISNNFKDCIINESAFLKLYSSNAEGENCWNKTKAVSKDSIDIKLLGEVEFDFVGSMLHLIYGKD